MPRGPRLDAPGVLHHVMARGIEGTKIFKDEDDYQDFIERLEKVLEENAGICYAWSLMSNHFHLLLKTGTGSLVKVMQRLMTGYVVNFNLRHKRTGHLFQNRYKSVICEEEPYLLELVRYIHLNPLRARIVAGMDGLDNYSWSGHAVLMGKEKAKWQEVDDILGRFGDKAGLARIKYRKFVEEGVSRGKRPELQGGGLIRSLGGWEEALNIRRREDRILSDARILGDGGFVSMVLNEAEQKEKPKDFIELIDLIKRVAEIMGMTEDDLKSMSKRQAISDTRAAISYLAVGRYGIRGVEVARKLGVGRSAVYRSVRRGKELVLKNPGLKNGFPD